jgi:hypothetical protein
MTRRFCLFLIAGAAGAQLLRPRVGYIVDRKGSLRPVEGVAGAFVLGPAVDSDIVSAAFSGKSLVIKKDRALIVDGETFEAPGGAVIVTFTPHGLLNEVFFREANELWRRNGAKFERTPAAAIEVGAVIQDGEFFLNGMPVRLQSRGQSVSQMGEGWWVVYAEDRLFAVRDEQVFELPEDPA